jgi:hypothetical protein
VFPKGILSIISSVADFEIPGRAINCVTQAHLYNCFSRPKLFLLLFSSKIDRPFSKILPSINNGLTGCDFRTFPVMTVNPFSKHLLTIALQHRKSGIRFRVKKFYS